MEKREIVRELVADHGQIRNLIYDLRRPGAPHRKKSGHIQRLSQWLKAHALGEQKTINQYAKHKNGLRVLGYEDKEEYATLETLLAKIQRTKNPYLWSARLQLLCDLVEHHLDEEEEEYFPLLRQQASEAERERMAVQYRLLTSDLEKIRTKPKAGFWSWLAGRQDPSEPDSLLH